MDDEPLVRAMPRRPLYLLRGLVTRIDLAVLTAIDDEGWFATRSAILADVDCKEVRVAVVVTREREALCAADGRIAHDADVGADCAGLAALKALAKATAERVTGGIARSVELAGYLNDDADPALRHVFVLAYRARVPAGTPAPDGLNWLAHDQLPPARDPYSTALAALLG